MAKGLTQMTQEEMQSIVHLLKKSATNLFRLLSNLLEWSSLQRGLIRLNRTEFLLKAKVSESLLMVEEGAVSKGVSIHYAIPDDLPVYADENMLEGILRNLVSNAVKFTPKGGSIIVLATPLGDASVEISIQDSGIGMSQQMIDNLFCLEGQTNRKGTEGELSTGLGLIICRDFIEKHGGKFSIESKVDNGSVFSFTLPKKA